MNFNGSLNDIHSNVLQYFKMLEYCFVRWISLSEFLMVTSLDAAVRICRICTLIYLDPALKGPE